MIFRNLPALITLVAALVAWIVTFIYKYELTKALIIIFASAFVFFMIKRKRQKKLKIHWRAMKQKRKTN